MTMKERDDLIAMLGRTENDVVSVVRRHSDMLIEEDDNTVSHAQPTN